MPDPDVVLGDDGVVRCAWGDADDLYRDYHDAEWGRPRADDRRLFEKLCLEGFQSGLSWLTILRKREAFRRAFRGFDAAAVARFNSRSVSRLMNDGGIVRNRAKIEATINNARRCLELIEECGSFAAYVWSFEPEVESEDHLRSVSEESAAMAADLRRRGWAFVGPTTIYAFMQAMGLVNDHAPGCEIRAEVERDRAAFRRPGRRRPSQSVPK
jgi:DNA-3-methyladenine glycosylase I